MVDDLGAVEDIKIGRVRIEDLAVNLVGDANIDHFQHMKNEEPCEIQG